MVVEARMGQAEALAATWRKGAADLSPRLTPDPAGVSGPIMVEDRPRAVNRMNSAADHLERALRNDDDHDMVRRELTALWPEFVAAGTNDLSLARAIAGARQPGSLKVAATGLLTTSVGLALKQPRSFGDH